MGSRTHSSVAFCLHAMNNKKHLAISLLFMLSVSFSSNGQKHTSGYIWPGFVQLNDSVFISQKEISISDYGEALGLMKRFLGSYERFAEAMPSPNTVSWTAYDPFTKTLYIIGQLLEVKEVSASDYKKKNKPSWFDTSVAYPPSIMYRPIVNVTKEQALFYCLLRTKAFPILRENTRKTKGWRLPDSVYFRLPSLEEWKLAFGEQSTDPRPNIFKKAPANVIISKDYLESLKTGESIPTSVYSGYVDSRGIINLCGNVSEMLMDAEDVYGGSFLDTIDTYSPAVKTSARPPQENIGFRIVAVIKPH
jgi:hypothetical protein